MMKRTYSILALAVFTAAGAQASMLSQQIDSMVDSVKKGLVAYENEDTFVQKVRLAWREQFQVAVVQPNGSNSLHLKKGASPVNQEFRRSWLGVTVDTASDTSFHTWVRVGGLPARETYSDGRTKRNFTYTNIYEIWVKQNIRPVKGLSVQVGKIISTDDITSIAAIYCPEYALTSLQFGQDSNWGVDITYEPNKKNKVYVQLMANDLASASKSMTHSDVYRDGRGAKGEFGWEDKCFINLGVNHRFVESNNGYQQIVAYYLHDFNNAYHSRRAPGANNYGPGFKDAISLGYEAKADRLLFLGDLIFAFEQQEGNGTNNIGLLLQPVYTLTPHVDLVLRYVGMTGHGACMLGADRYITTQTTAPGWVDSIHTFYVGANFYASAKDKNALKLMLGAEYTTARKGGSDCYNGWEFTTSVRWSF